MKIVELNHISRIYHTGDRDIYAPVSYTHLMDAFYTKAGRRAAAVRDIKSCFK